MRSQRDQHDSDWTSAGDDDLQALLVLELAEAEAGESGFAAHALRQLAAREELYGRGATTPCGLARLIDELSDAAANLGGCSAFGLGRVLDTHACPPGKKDEGERSQLDLIGTSLHAIVLWAAFSHSALSIARGHLLALDPPGQRYR
jgi:hypothetical protein